MNAPTPTAPAAPAAPSTPQTPAPSTEKVRQPSFADKLTPRPGTPKAPEAPATPKNGTPSTRSSEPKGAAAPAEPSGGDSAPVPVKFVVDGKPVTVEMSSEEAAFLEKNPKFKARFQKSLGADRAFETGTKLRQQAEDIIEMLKDPDAVFDHVLKHPALGHKDVRTLVEGWLLKQIELDRMDPKDRELMTTKQELEAIKQREEAEKKTASQKRHEELTKKFEGDYQTDIISAVKSSNLPANEETVGRVAFYLHAALTQYGKELKAADVMPLVKQDYERMVRRLFSTSNGQALAEILGEDGLKKIRQYELDRLKNPTPGNNGGKPPPRVPGAQPSHQNGSKKPMSTDEWRAMLQRRRLESE